MTIVNLSADCGNSPKNIFLQDMTVAFATGETQYILARVTDEISWNSVGQWLVQGKAEFRHALEQMASSQVAEITIKHVLSHGKAGAVNGLTRLENGATFAFCDVYEFGNAKGTTVSEITSYVIDLS